MRVAEIFYSIQGEGPAMGRPATFIRLAGCNLRCEGCDTHILQWADLSCAAVMKKIRGSRAVITGGEPTLQMAEISELISLLHGEGIEIYIESNGTNLLSGDLLEKIHYAVISPKAGSDFHLDYWSGKENVHFKFVIGNSPWCWNSRLLEDLVASLPRERVWIMAYGTDQEMRGAREAWDLALQLGVNYSDRLHIRLRRR